MNYERINDYELLYMISDGSDEYLSLIIEKYEPLVMKCIYKWQWIFKTLNLEIDDVRQELYILLIKSLQRYNDNYTDASFGTYFYSFVNNYFKTRIEQYNKKKDYLLHSFEDLTFDDSKIDYLKILTYEDTSILGDYDYYVCQDRIKNFCYSLPILEASIFELSLNGYKDSEISILLNSESRYIYNILFRIRKKLRKIY